MDAIERWLREVLQLAGEIYFKWVEEQLGALSQALYAWLEELFEHPRANWREGFAQFVAGQEAEGRIILPVSRQAVLDYLDGWSKSVDWSAIERENSQRSNPALADVSAGWQVDGTSLPAAPRFEPPRFEPPTIGDVTGAGKLDELLDPELPPLVHSDEEYRKAQRAEHGDSPPAMWWIALNEAINRYVWGIEDRHKALETPGERTANDLADTAAAAADLALGAAGAGKLKGRSVAKTPTPRTMRVREPVDKSWKELIVGDAQRTGTEGHAFRVYREAIKMAKSGQYDKIWLNRSYSTVTGTTTTPRRLPDIIARRKTGQFDAIEVPSKTDLEDALIGRNRQAMNQLPEELRGDIRLAPIAGSNQ